jgi:hypothetical protein
MQKHRIASALVGVALAAMAACTRPGRSQQRMFDSPEEAVPRSRVVQAADVEQLSALFGPDSKELVDTSDPVTARRNRETFSAAFTEGWRLTDDEHGGKTLVIGNEEWPFPVPLTKDGNRWRFDTAAGKAEVLARRIGRNELAVIRIGDTYVAAQRRYAESGQRKPAGLYAQAFGRCPGQERAVLASRQNAQPARRPGRAGRERRPGDRRASSRRRSTECAESSCRDRPRRAKSVTNGNMSAAGARRLAAEMRSHRHHDVHRQQDGIVHERLGTRLGRDRQQNDQYDRWVVAPDRVADLSSHRAEGLAGPLHQFVRRWLDVLKRVWDSGCAKRPI